MRSWKAAYLSEVKKREALEKELFGTVQVPMHDAHGINSNHVVTKQFCPNAEKNELEVVYFVIPVSLLLR